ncbi:CIC_collapsed_G0000860.mRNA.1.CDS.1 [Saccharomyces cerevisiae]|nr:CIC_collapsed_G0000860.mRNA.1.CDS.1 [Saccharomyces cerevisiae]
MLCTRTTFPSRRRSSQSMVSSHGMEVLPDNIAGTVTVYDCLRSKCRFLGYTSQLGVTLPDGTTVSDDLKGYDDIPLHNNRDPDQIGPFQTLLKFILSVIRNTKPSHG